MNALERPEAQRPASPASPAGRGSFLQSWYARDTESMLSLLRAANIVDGILITLCYPLALTFSVADLSIFSNLFFFSYCTGFGILLVLFECNTKALRARLKRNFGFMFSFLGRGFFLFFLASLCYISDSGLGTLIAIFTLLNACLNVFAMLTRREFKAGGQLSIWRDPTQNYQSNAASARQFAENNPELARKAAAQAVEVARQNPDAARSAAEAFY